MPIFFIFIAVSGFTQAGDPFVLITNSNPDLQTMFSADIPLMNCFFVDH